MQKKKEVEINILRMYEKIFQVHKIGEPTYLPAPEQGEPDGLLRREITLVSCEYEESERDKIVATLWDDDAFLELETGDEVMVTLQFVVAHTIDGEHLLRANIVDIKHLKSD